MNPLLNAYSNYHLFKLKMKFCSPVCDVDNLEREREGER
jgi:hypothetical protein